ncbi:hypothetical protein AB1Y20_009344 [Prymnesium parvum]|uniref:Uncharacterized protein n=1 Tax=Prymnesium parvum TaxID=97485 RepID=A0AB34K0G6_PRYPA
MHSVPAVVPAADGWPRVARLAGALRVPFDRRNEPRRSLLEGTSSGPKGGGPWTWKLFFAGALLFLVASAGVCALLASMAGAEPARAEGPPPVAVEAASTEESVALSPSALHSWLLAASGLWYGNVEISPLGPMPTGMGGYAYMAVSAMDRDGSFYVRHLGLHQLMRIRGALMQYCFGYDHPEQRVAGADEAPFAVDAVDPTMLRMCWRGPRLPSHPLGCSGCSCAQWTLTRQGDQLQSVFLQPPPVMHMRITLSRRGSHPSLPADEVRAGWACEFNNHTGKPNITHSPLEPSRSATTSPCPFGVRQNRTTREDGAPGARVPERRTFCLRMNDVVPAQLEYSVAQLPCWPCNVTFTLSVQTARAGDYVAIGFKEKYAAYYGPEKVRQLEDYWGMATSAANRTELAGRILAGYVSPTGVGGCLRQLQANAFVGSVVDVPSDGKVRMESVRRVGNATSITFSTTMHAGRNESEISWQSRVFGEQRVMWATGAVPGDGGCGQQLGYHSSTRSLASLNFPGFGRPC